MYKYIVRHHKLPAKTDIKNQVNLTPLTLASKLGRHTIFKEMLELGSLVRSWGWLGGIFIKNQGVETKFQGSTLCHLNFEKDFNASWVNIFFQRISIKNFYISTAWLLGHSGLGYKIPVMSGNVEFDIWCYLGTKYLDMEKWNYPLKPCYLMISETYAWTS